MMSLSQRLMPCDKPTTKEGRELSCLDAMLDEPSMNARYGRMTKRKKVRKVVLRRDDPVDDSTGKSKESERQS